MGRYGKALGVWELKLGEETLQLHPTMQDNDNFRQVMMGNERAKSITRIKEFEKWLYQVIVHEYPPVDEEEENELREQINFNATKLFEKTMVDFKYATAEEMVAEKKALNDDLKKEIGAN